MAKNGYIKYHRSILEWEHSKDWAVRIIFENLLLTADYKPIVFNGKHYPPGTRVCTIHEIAAESGGTYKQVRRAFKQLQKSGEIEVEVRKNKYHIIIIRNYSKYQVVQPEEKVATKPDIPLIINDF